MRELKPIELERGLRKRSRTPPGVRELKPLRCVRRIRTLYGRTPPGVRELKRFDGTESTDQFIVAPLPGCVN